MKFLHYFNCDCKTRDGRPMQLSAVTGGHVRCKCGTQWYVDNPIRYQTDKPARTSLTINASGLLESEHADNCACPVCAILRYLGEPEEEAAT